MAFTPNTEPSSPVKPEQKPTLAAPTLTKRMAGDFIPEVTITVDKLPSKGLAYPKNAIIKYRAYSFGEIKKISQERLPEKDTIEFVLSGVECSFEKHLLTLADVLYIGLLRKISTIQGNKVIIQFKCGKCASIEKPVYDLMGLEFDDMKAPELPITAEVCGGEYSFMPMTVSQYFELCDEGMQKDTMRYMAKQAINSDEKTHEIFFRASMEDGLVLTEVDKLLYHGLKPINASCSKCKQSNEIELDGGQALILPFREFQEPPQARIRFGSKASHKPGGH